MEAISAVLPLVPPAVIGVALYRKRQFEKFNRRVRGAVNDVSYYMRELAEGDPDKELAWIKHDNDMRHTLMRASFDELEYSFMFWRSLSSVYPQGFLDTLWKAWAKVPEDKRRTY